MNLPQADLHALASAFGTGPMDRNAGGFLEVRWMAFVRELMALQPNSRWNTPQGTPRAADMPPLNTAEAQEYQERPEPAGAHDPGRPPDDGQGPAPAPAGSMSGTIAHQTVLLVVQPLESQRSSGLGGGSHALGA